MRGRQAKLSFAWCGIRKRFGETKRTPLREVSKFIVAFQRQTEIVIVWNLNPYTEALISTSDLRVRLDYRWLRHLSRNMQHWVNWDRKWYIFQYLLRTILLDFMEFQMIIAMAENCEWASCLLSCDWRWLALCEVYSEFAMARLICTLKAAQNSFWHFSRNRFWWFIIATLYQLMLQSWYPKNAQSPVNTLVSFLWQNRYQSSTITC